MAVSREAYWAIDFGVRQDLRDFNPYAKREVERRLALPYTDRAHMVGQYDLEGTLHVESPDAVNRAKKHEAERIEAILMELGRMIEI